MRRLRLQKMFCAGLAGALLAGAAFGGAPVAARAADAVAATQQGLQPLVIDTASGKHRFRVELARTEAERERGLMFRRDLPADRGMLFQFASPQPVMMWMKNTYIPLDMIFIARDGRVTHIAANAEPLSETIITSDGPAFAVLEVNAGTAARIGLTPGDKIENALFPR